VSSFSKTKVLTSFSQLIIGLNIIFLIFWFSDTTGLIKKIRKKIRVNFPIIFLSEFFKLSFWELIGIITVENDDKQKADDDHY